MPVGTAIEKAPGCVPGGNIFFADGRMAPLMLPLSLRQEGLLRRAGEPCRSYRLPWARRLRACTSSENLSWGLYQRRSYPRPCFACALRNFGSPRALGSIPALQMDGPAYVSQWRNAGAVLHCSSASRRHGDAPAKSTTRASRAKASLRKGRPKRATT